MDPMMLNTIKTMPTVILTMRSVAPTLIFILTRFGWGLGYPVLHTVLNRDCTTYSITRCSTLRQISHTGVSGIHDLHVWAMSTAENALTAHLVVASPAADRDTVLQHATTMLHTRFAIGHVVLQLESATYARFCPSSNCNSRF
jgi:Co/Zn/Cd efflux system component